MVVGIERLPDVVLKSTVVPSVTLFPLVSFTVAVIMVLVMPSAGIVSHPAVSSSEPTWKLIRPMSTVPEMPLVDAVIVSFPPAGTELGAV